MIWSKVPRNALGRPASDQSGRCKQRELIRFVEKAKSSMGSLVAPYFKLRAQLYRCTEHCSVGNTALVLWFFGIFR